MKSIVIILLSVFIVGTSASKVYSKPLMAFGYLVNKSDNKNYDYLQTIFPNSFANSIKNIFDVNVIKPHRINENLKKYNIKLKKDYKFFELPEAIKKIDSDLFIYGNFTPLSNNRIKIVMTLYARGTNRVLTFSNVGKMETEIFKLVDRITLILISFMDKKKNIYQTKLIPKNASLGIITNLKSEYLNEMYYSFLKKGYRVYGVGGNYIKNVVTEDIINAYRYMFTKNNSYDIITDIRKTKLLYGTWSSKRYMDKVKSFKEMFIKYDYKYLDTKNKILEKLSSAYKNKMRYLLIIGFKDKTSAWVRCIDLKNKDLILLQGRINGSSVEEISQKIINSMSTKIKIPYMKN
ncbi:hypothetical protein ACFL20_00125 [Spirochaetota bacterium]